MSRREKFYLEPTAPGEDERPLIMTASGRMDSPVCKAYSKEFGALILRSLNSHEALVAACKAALERLEASCPPNGGRTEAVCEQIKAALALERGQEQEKR